MPSASKIFSLSIDEDVRWGTAEIDPRDGAYLSPPKLDEIASNKLLDLRTKKPVDLEASLRAALTALRDKKPEAIADVAAVGISSVGIVDREEKLLLNFDRRNWRLQPSASGDRSCMVDFGRILREFFSPKTKIEVYNDAIAKAMAEYEHSHRRNKGALRQRDEFSDKEINIFCYANFHYGVNAGYVFETRAELPWACEEFPSSLHQEVGHTSAPPVPGAPPFDRRFSACPVHDTCFVGVAGATRIINEWGAPLHELPYDEKAPWSPRKEIAILAAHFLHNVVLNIAPTKIGLAGCVMFPEMVELIDFHFKRINSYKDNPYIDYPALRRPRFISMTRLTVEQAGIIGGLELARRSFRQKPADLNQMRRHG